MDNLSFRIEPDRMYVTACGFIVRITEPHPMRDGGSGFVGIRMSRDRKFELYQDDAAWYFTSGGRHFGGDEGLNIIGPFVERTYH